MIFLDTDEHYFITKTRANMADTLLEHLPAEPDNETLAKLATACLNDPLEVIREV